MERPLTPSNAPKDDVILRPGRPDDAAACATICFEAFAGINDRHHFPRDFPVSEQTAGMMSFIFAQPFIDSVVAEQDGRIVGSNFLWCGSSVGGVGPITVDPSV